MTTFDGSGKEAFWKHCGNRRNCLYKQFLLSPLCFLLHQRQKSSFLLHLSSANTFNLVWSKILLSGNGLKFSKVSASCKLTIIMYNNSMITFQSLFCRVHAAVMFKTILLIFTPLTWLCFKILCTVVMLLNIFVDASLEPKNGLQIFVHQNLNVRSN